MQPLIEAGFNLAIVIIIFLTILARKAVSPVFIRGKLASLRSALRSVGAPLR